MVTLPAATPVMIPVAEPVVAMAVLLLLQEPPATVPLNVEAEPAHIVAAPEIVPADGAEFTVTVAVTTVVPHPAVTE